MTARVLVVDDILPNVKLLEAKLTSEYFDVLCATSGPEALDIIQREQPDIVLLDVMMPGMNGFEVCTKLKSDISTAHIPVVMVTALDQPSDRVAGLEAGADDFLTKPVKDIALFARVRSLVRLKVTMDEFRNREATEINLGGESGLVEEFSFLPESTSVLLVEENERNAEVLMESLSEVCTVELKIGGKEIAEKAREKNFDLVIVNLNMSGTDGLRICSKLRSFEETRQVPILVLVDEDDTKLLVRALEMGVNDYLITPLDKLELLARVKTQLKRKRFSDQLRENLHLSMRLAITDAVTGLYNRHYMTSHLETLAESTKSKGKQLAVALLDIDFFKKVNDTYGHAAGDEVLKEFSDRIARNVRGVDLAARYGGEEFVVVMPETSLWEADKIADRLRRTISDEGFTVSVHDEKLDITVSIGLALLDGVKTTSAVLEKADRALYVAKGSGRNKVCIAEEDADKLVKPV
jgi:two-component system cell cycle response regulator